MTRTLSAFVRPIRPRDPHESHRAATPLELLTDLCFVVAIAQAAASLHHAISEDHVLLGLRSFVFVFFAIWWAWVNFSWFASAYDNDDIFYRLLTMLQILGSLVLAAGIGRMFEGDFVLGVLGYVIMRIGLVVQWLRAARNDPGRRRTATRYAAGIVLVQLCWVAFLFVPAGGAVAAFVVFAAFEFIVPVVAERSGQTPWHPHHIAERYGLLFIIVLGEVILSTTVAIQEALDEQHPAPELGYVVAGGLLIIFSLWWLYFSRESGTVLASAAGTEDNSIAYLWGFGHYFVFASGAAIGAGLAARVDYWTEHTDASRVVSAAAVTVPTAVLLVTLWLVCLRHHDRSGRTAGVFAAASLLVLAATLTPAPELAAGLVCALLLALQLWVAAHAPSGHGPSGNEDVHDGTRGR